MPKGEHFKKENPRNYQVSFKVNKTELEKLKGLASANNLSVPEWLRTHIHADHKSPHVVKQKPSKKVKPTIKATTQTSAPKGEQTSLF